MDVIMSSILHGHNVEARALHADHVSGGARAESAGQLAVQACLLMLAVYPCETGFAVGLL